MLEENKTRVGRIGNEIRHLGCYLYADAETGSANGEIHALARKSTLHLGPSRSFRLIGEIGEQEDAGTDKTLESCYRRPLRALGWDFGQTGANERE